MGVVSGIVMSYQFGTNWSVFSDVAGPVIGPLMAYEVLTAFFLEAGFLGVMLFMLVYYRFSGVNANVALLINLILLMGAMAYFGISIGFVTSNMPLLLFVLMLPYNVYFIERYRDTAPGERIRKAWLDRLATEGRCPHFDRGEQYPDAYRSEDL